MIDSSAPVEQPQEQSAAEPVAQEAAPVVEAVAAPADPDAAFDADVQTHGVQLPEGEILVPLSSVTTLRQKLKDAKAGSAEAAGLKQQLDAANQQLQAIGPLAEAFRAMQQAQQQQPQQAQQQAPPVEDTTELQEIAKDFDFYKADGTPDLDKARRVQAREEKRAGAIADQRVAPLVQHTLQQRVAHNIERAIATSHPVTKQVADPQILKALVGQIANQPHGLQTLADPEAMKQVWLNAYALSTFQQPPAAKEEPAPPAKETPAPPVFTERAGGRMPAQKALSPTEKRAAKDAGLTEAQYLKEAADMPW